MKYNLSALARQAGYRRKRTVFRPNFPPKTLGSELATIMFEVVRAWEGQRSSIMAEYERSLSDLMQDSAADVEREVARAATLSESIVILITPRLVRWLGRLEKWQRDKWTAAVLTPTTVNLGTILTIGDVQETLDGYLARNLALIKDVSAQIQGKISDSVFRGLQARSPARAVAKEISEATGFARKRSIRIASDQLQKITSALDAERMRQAGLDKYEWQHSGKVHFRVDHKARDGKEYTIGEPDGDEPGFLPFCGCKRKPILSLDD